ncbi:aminotransferase class I/II-fold pyridoxal phosphate-dependent enzyme [Scatolibacter rhodanostii]|uniref:aminotransferase class I/II-fold pyridoxal phosphate-dependent enzyme n=1 Tax=Scatolibacter rhodanostii TaxID=2014781 RepID=UPI000C08B1FA|nr:aminotransferase class I/II-fold pyridoxal phosphate-dependent enzyme [Scatolibacter rhodanostii]
MKDLLDYLEEYSASGFYPMHMPGHKRNTTIQMPNPYAIDITEIDGFDNLHHAEDLLKAGMQRTADLYKTIQSFHLVNGSTVGILSSILAGTKRGDTIIMARNCHKAIYNALILNELNPVYILPEYDESFDINGSISVEKIRAVIEENPIAKMVVITSPTYEGVISDIQTIANLCHEKGMLLFVDEAHGAHLGLHPAFPQSAVSQGADLVVQSLHKTLPSLTQTAVLHVCSDRISVESVRKKLEVLETSSPSYVLMASIERCVNILIEQGEELFSAWQEQLAWFGTKVKNLTKFRVFGYAEERKKSNSTFYGFDSSKLVISTKGTDFTGAKLADLLRREQKIEPEMVSANYIIAMTSLYDSHEGYKRLAEGVLLADKMTQAQKSKIMVQPPVGRMVINLAQAQQSEEEVIAFSKSAGRTAKDFVFAYPPGIPILAPGEKISTEIIEYVESLKGSGVKIEVSGKENHSIAVIKKADK